jgi:sortase (surface protein transpeptidase)
LPSAPTPPQSNLIQASPLISAPRPQWHTLKLDEKYRQAQAQAQEEAEAEAKSSVSEQRDQATVEKEPNLSEVRPLLAPA